MRTLLRSLVVVLFAAVSAVASAQQVTAYLNGRAMACSAGTPDGGRELFCRCDHPNNAYDGQLWVIESDQNGNNARDVIHLGTFASVNACEAFMFQHPQCNANAGVNLAVNVDGTNFNCGDQAGGYPRRYCRCDHPNDAYDGQLWIIEVQQNGNTQDVRHVSDFASTAECNDYLVRAPDCRL